MNNKQYNYLLAISGMFWLFIGIILKGDILIGYGIGILIISILQFFIKTW